MRSAPALSPLVASVAALAPCLAALGAVGRQAPPAQDVTPQELFGRLIREDPRTTTAIRRLLTSGAGFVAARPLFGDLTGDGRDDAVVTVATPGAAGAVVAYVFSANGSSADRLRAVYRTQRQYRLLVRLAGATMTLVAPAWRRGDDLCCPSRLLERDFSWSRRARAFIRRAQRTIEHGAKARSLGAAR
jgi:hypothetical protein